ncbi:hypothetical protein [Dyella acidisoli]|uniref:Secreted protein n=2 Tax=Dyella acidisoli TaxID=1867834 RepID=A0ABQ5XNC6_9GAMM|nr:hypothetical protein GCM10007901_20290 [Dyella acidisoli]
MQPKLMSGLRGGLLAATVMGLLGSVSVSSSAVAQTPSDVATQATKEALESWHDSVRHLAPPTTGCFEANYPSTVWKSVACSAGTLKARPAPKFKKAISANGMDLYTVGGGNDYAVKTASLTSLANMWFPEATGLTSEQSGGAQSGAGSNGSNLYTLQGNTQLQVNSVGCTQYGYTSCAAWEQFVYGTGVTSTGESGAFIQTWIFIPGGENCPAGFQATPYGASPELSTGCVTNSNIAITPAEPATNLAHMGIVATATAGGNDVITYTYDGKAYSVSQPDSTVQLAKWWNTTEFNVFGDGGAGEAQFTAGSSGATVKVRVGVDDGSTAAPTCLGSYGTTGETNNFTLGNCTATAGSASARPAINFTETLP